MRYQALATDYDGTLAEQGRVDDRTVAAVERLRGSGRRIVLVTGRIRADLERVFPRVGVFDLVVAENGATVWRPGSDERLLTGPPPAPFLDVLRERGVPFDVGRAIVATVEPHETAVLAAVRELGLDLQLVFNKGAVMVLPPGVTKATGLEAALGSLGLTLHEALAIGDAENDVAMLTASEYGVAVSNALPAVQEAADLVTQGARGAGVAEIVDALLADDLEAVDPPRHHLAIGTAGDRAVALSPTGTRALVAGPPGEERSRAARAVAGPLVERGYQLCVVAPGGGPDLVPGLPRLGSPQRGPEVEEVAALLARSRTSVTVDLAAVAVPARPALVARLLRRLEEARERTSRPHWLVLDDADALAPRAAEAIHDAPGSWPASFLLVTARPGSISEDLLARVNVAITVGDRARAMLAEVTAAAGHRSPVQARVLRDGEALLWRAGDRAEVLSVAPPAEPRLRADHGVAGRAPGR